MQHSGVSGILGLTGKMVHDYGFPWGQKSPYLHRAHTARRLEKSASVSSGTMVSPWIYADLCGT